jgi:outer membrane protein TolC
LEIRNRSAGAALDLFFRIAEAEIKDDLLALGGTALAGAYRQAKDLADRGFKLPIELGSLDRQRLEAAADRTRLQGALIDLNSKLKGLIGQDNLPIDEHLWPASVPTINYAPIDPEAAIQQALEQRAELQLLRILQCRLDAKSLPVVREFLKGFNASLGVPEGANSPLGQLSAAVSAHASERAVRYDQIHQLLAEREKAVANEVRDALSQLKVQGQLVDLDRQRVLAWQARVHEMEDRLDKGEANFLDVLNSRLEWYKARAALAADVTGWHRAEVQLRLAQGVLVGECCGVGK